MGNIVTVGPDKCAVISGSIFNSKSRKCLIGQMGWCWWIVSDVSRLSLEIMTTRPSCEDVETRQGVRVSISSVCQIRIIHNDKDLLNLALEQLLGKSQEDIISLCEKTLDGHLRSILGTMTVEELYMDREEFSRKVREVAAPDMARMGIEILSFTIIDLVDHDDYLVSLGRTKVASVKRDADVGSAEATRDAKIKIANLEKIENEIIFVSNTRKAEYKSNYDTTCANLRVEVKQCEAEAQLAGKIESAKQQQLIKEQIMKSDLIKNKKQTEIEEIEIERVKYYLESTINKKTEIEVEVMNMIAENDKFEFFFKLFITIRECLLMKTEADAEKIKLKGLAEAEALGLIGQAEAEAMRIKAHAFNNYGDMAIYHMILNSLPDIVDKITRPLAKTKDIIILNGSSTTDNINSLLSNIPPAVESLTGVDISNAIQKLGGFDKLSRN